MNFIASFLILAGAVLSASPSFAQQECIEQNFSKVYDDVETDCFELAKAILVEHGCPADLAQHKLLVSSGSGMVNLQNGSAGFCKYTLKEGILQIMTDEMNPNPRAAVFFSRWD